MSSLPAVAYRQPGTAGKPRCALAQPSDQNELSLEERSVKRLENQHVLRPLGLIRLGSADVRERTGAVTPDGWTPNGSEVPHSRPSAPVPSASRGGTPPGRCQILRQGGPGSPLTGRGAKKPDRPIPAAADTPRGGRRGILSGPLAAASR